MITERYHSDDGTLDGFSIYGIPPRAEAMAADLVDAQGGHFDLVGGPTTTPTSFYFENKRITETQPFQRMIFQDVKPDSFTWRWQMRPTAADPWSDSWVIQYRRKRS